MPRKVCPICGHDYIHNARKLYVFKREIERQYECTNCGKVSLDLDRNLWQHSWSTIERAMK